MIGGFSREVITDLFLETKTWQPAKKKEIKGADFERESSFTRLTSSKQHRREEEDNNFIMAYRMVDLAQRGWQLHHSRRQARPYFFNATTGESRWILPPMTPPPPPPQASPNYEAQVDMEEWDVATPPASPNYEAQIDMEEWDVDTPPVSPQQPQFQLPPELQPYVDSVMDPETEAFVNNLLRQFGIIPPDRELDQFAAEMRAVNGRMDEHIVAMPDAAEYFNLLDQVEGDLDQTGRGETPPPPPPPLSDDQFMQRFV